MSKRGRAIRSEHALDCALCQARAYAEAQLVPIRFLLVRVRRAARRGTARRRRGVLGGDMQTTSTAGRLLPPAAHSTA